ncbi:unnamed protein product [Ectocarpus sp. 13 AM-2016]
MRGGQRRQPDRHHHFQVACGEMAVSVANTRSFRTILVVFFCIRSETHRRRIWR